MAEILASGYQSIRNFVEANWKYIELQKTDGTPVVRLTTSDTRVTWIHTANAQTLILQVVIKGSDADMTGSLPKEFGKSAIFSVATGGTPHSVETFSSFTLETAGDELTVQHQLQIPQVV